jgi:prevent-host-death family protein
MLKPRSKPTPEAARKAMPKIVRTLNLYEAKTRLSRLVEDAAQGEEIVIAKAGVPRARLVGLASKKRLRRPGSAKGRIWISTDFDAPLPPDLVAAFMGGRTR